LHFTRQNFALQNLGGFYGRMVDALGDPGEEGRGVPAISLGEVASNL